MKNTQLLDQCVRDAFAGTMTFPETIGRMASIGVRWYSANLALGMKTHYFDDGTTHPVKWPEWTAPAKCPAFDADGVASALRAIQRREIIYPEFLRRIADAGVIVYTVHLRGRKAIYLGADGDTYVEPFPQ